MRPSRSLPAIFLLLWSSLPAFAADGPALSISPAEWKFGMIRQGEEIQLTVTVANQGTGPVTVSFVPTCSCIGAEPLSQEISAGGSGRFVLRYDSSDDTGNTERGFIVKMEPSGEKPLYYLLRGTVRQHRDGAAGQGGGTSAGASQGSAGTGTPGVVTVSYYYTPGCRSCEEFLSEELPRMEKELGIRVVVEKKDVLDSSLYEELSALAAARGGAITAVPVLRVGDELLQGDKAIRGGLRKALTAAVAVGPKPDSPEDGGRDGAAAGASAPADSGASAPATEKLAILPVITAGLIDGINPCAFTTLIFLLASLALAGRGRREVLLIGTLFSLSVFATYFLVGLGFFAALRAASAVSIVSVILRWVLVVVLLVFAGLSVYDYVLIRMGRPTEMLLQLPSALKKRIHASIRTQVRTAAIAGSSLVLGFLVSIFEFACTGQVYLPTLGYLARVHRQSYAIGLLALYNFCFILPLLAVFTASYLGVSSSRITTAFQAHMGKVKLGLAVVFVGLAVFTLVG